METSDFRSTFLPYCLLRLSDGTYAVLNREYKPMGLLTLDWVRYEDYPRLHRQRITPAFAAKVSHNASSALDRIYLYNDGCIPSNSAEDMNDYLKRLSFLSELKVSIH